MTNTNYNPRCRDAQENQVKPDWYRRFLNRVVCYNAFPAVHLPTRTSLDKSSSLATHI